MQLGKGAAGLECLSHYIFFKKGFLVVSYKSEVIWKELD